MERCNSLVSRFRYLVALFLFIVLLSFSFRSNNSGDRNQLSGSCVVIDTAFQSAPQLSKPVIFVPRYFHPTPLLTVRTAADEELYKNLVQSDAWGVFYTIRDILTRYDKSSEYTALVLDWGVNFGFVSILASKLGFFVAGVEAHPLTHKQLNFNLLINCLSNDTIHVLNMGLGREKSMAIISSGGISGANSISNFVNAKGPKNVDTIEIAVNTWDAIVDSFHFSIRKRAYLLKIDVEGSEVNALLGAKKYLAEYPPKYIVFELSQFGFADKGMAVCKMIIDLKYKLFVVGGQDQGLREESLEKWLNWASRPIHNIDSFVNAGYLGDLIGVFDG